MEAIENPLLIFDLGNVILRHDNLYWMEQLTGACADEATARAVIETYLFRPSADEGRSSVETFFIAAKDEMGFNGDYAAFEKLWCCHFTHDTEMEMLVEALAAKYNVVLLSNTDDAHWHHIGINYPVLQKLKSLYTSFELGMRKPDLQIYRHVLDAEERKAKEAIFIDDKIENVEAANALGIHGIHFTGIDALKADLKALGVDAYGK